MSALLYIIIKNHVHVVNILLKLYKVCNVIRNRENSKNN